MPDMLNRQSVNDNGVVSNYAPPNGLNQHTTVNGVTLNYDGDFNLWSGPNGFSATFYDGEDYLLSATKGGNSVQFVHDGLGRCVKRTVNGVARFITYDDWNPIYEWDASGNAVAANFYGARADEIIGRWDSSWGFQFYKQDKQGNVVAVLNQSGAIVEKYRYDAFGTPKILSTNNTQLSTSAIGNRFMYTGREWLPELGIYDYRHRYYQPLLGRFLQTDPTGFDAGDMNLFRYCDDDAVDQTDPTGLVSMQSGSTIEERLRLFYGSNAGGSLYQLDHRDEGLTMATVPRNAENQGGVRHGDGYGSSPVEAGLQREGDAKKIARGDSEGVTEIGQDTTNPKQFYSPPAHGGNKEVSNFTDDVKKDKAPVAVSYVDPARLPNNYKLVGGVVGYRLFSPGRAREDIQRAKNAGWRTFIMTAPERKVPVIYDKYTSPNPVF